MSVFIPKIEFEDLSFLADKWHWNFGDDTIDSIPSPVHSYADSGTYVIKQLVETANGCKDSAYKAIRITPELAINIPNAFTPNEDNLNDDFAPKMEGIVDDQYNFLIFTRWGELVFEGHNLSDSWNGDILDTNTPAKADVYVYKIDFMDIHRKKHTYTGHVTLIR